MRILFVLDHPGLLIHFDDTIRELADRGHTLKVLFARPHKWRTALEDFEVPESGVEIASYAAARSRDVRAGEPIEAGPDVIAEISGASPDVVVVSPLVQGKKDSDQAEYVVAAQSLDIPAVACIASWDNLTTRARMRAIPDRVTLWNETQRGEAVELHGVPAERIVLTGAQQFDRWFSRSPSTTPEAFRQAMGLPAERPFLLFAGMSRWPKQPDEEEKFVHEWLRRLRSAPHRLREMSVLLRPHPTTAGRWEGIDLGDDAAVVWSREHPLPVGDDERSAYFDAIYHSEAMVSPNSSAMIEAAIVGRPVHTVSLPEWHSMQHRLVHFRYMLEENGGFLRVSHDFDSHFDLLAGDLDDPTRWRPAQERFVEASIRPHGLDQPALPLLVAAIEGAETPKAAVAGSQVGI